MSGRRFARGAARGRKGRTDWKRVEALTDEEIDRGIAADPEAAPILDAKWFREAELVVPEKQMISIRLDSDILEHFRKTGPRWQTRMNAVLRAYVRAADRKHA